MECSFACSVTESKSLQPSWMVCWSNFFSYFIEFLIHVVCWFCMWIVGIANGSVLTIGLSTFEVAINWLSITDKFREKIKMINLFYHDDMTSKVHIFILNTAYIFSCNV